MAEPTTDRWSTTDAGHDLISWVGHQWHNEGTVSRDVAEEVRAAVVHIERQAGENALKAALARLTDEAVRAALVVLPPPSKMDDYAREVALRLRAILDAERTRRYKIVFEDLAEVAARDLGPMAGALSYGITISAVSQAEAERIASEAGADNLGRWHVEEVAHE